MYEKSTSASFSLVSISKHYNQSVALDPTDLEIEAGEYLVLLGPSGSGKTTLLMILAGFVQPTSGDIRCRGVSIRDLPPEKRGFGVVFQGYALFPHLSVSENIAFPLQVRGVSRDEIGSLVRRTMDIMKLTQLSERLPRQLSGGQQQRVALARALVFNPPLLLLDEPMSALDKKLKDELQAELKDIHRRIGTTFVHITHDQEEAMSLADRIAVMREGRIVQIGSPQDLYNRPSSEFVAGFLGKSNFIRGEIENVEGDSLTLRVDKYSLRQPLPERAVGIGQPLTVAVRPEWTSVGVEKSHLNVLRGVVTSVLFFGKHWEVRVDVPRIGVMTAHVDGNAVVPVIGSAIAVSWPIGCGVTVDV